MKSRAEMTPSEREEIDFNSASDIQRKINIDYPKARFIQESFFTQVAKARAEEREKLAQFMLARNFSTGHGDTIEDLLKELDWNINKLEKE